MLRNPKLKTKQNNSTSNSEDNQNLDNLDCEALLDRGDRQNIQQVRSLATKTDTTPDKLRKLATSRDRAVRENLVTNPNTPIDILWELGAQFPEHLLKNPKFERLIQANSIFLKQMPFKTVSNLFFHKETNERIREQLISYHPGLMDY